MKLPHLASLNGILDTLPTIPKLPTLQRTRKTSKIIGFLDKNTSNFHEQLPLQTTRRTALALASIALVGTSSNGISLAEDNGYWITDLLSVPSVENNITNPETGTRSFIKTGVYVANLNTKNRMYRLKKYAFDLPAMADLIGPDTLNYVKKYLRLKSTVMYYDFDKLISAAAVDDKQPLITLANRLFDSFEKVKDVGSSKMRNFPQTESCYRDTKVILQEVMDRMA
ncbi:photosynthetic NDH subunit of lumenal location 3, chloroplastic-like isoform X2 [Hibiscus syriacus]|uniref:photosynthetic NDH subunit of lumenal location 3, chloroplastic-like isoform X2 n=1 Tax=Hibiscus syriacus TaxID=106335 RepID=UPI00192216F0|nr:photosynthetic NDH subunit of lumenal location 3, chloroplastic-like isoform X2 [Hibiscus syriacus]